MIVGYNIEITDKDINSTRFGEVTSVDSDKILFVKMGSTIPSNTLSNTFSLENQLLKGDSSELDISNFNANVLNAYYKNGSKYLIASNSVPNYEDEIRCDQKTFTFSGSATNDIFGFLSKFKISDEPYPTPSEETFALVILPLKMG